MPRYFKASSRNNGGGTRYQFLDNYKVIGSNEDYLQRVPYGEVQVEINDERSFPNFDFSDQPTNYTHKKVARNIGISGEYLDAHENFDTFNALASARSIADNRGTSFARYDGIHYAKNIKNLKNDPEFQPTELFTTTPKSVEIKTAHFDPSLNSSFLTVAAMIHKEHGIPITASDNLSKWSSAISKNAKERGLPVVSHEYNPDMDQTNEMQQEGRVPKRMYSDYVENNMKNYLGFTEIPTHEVKDARQHLRTLLGHPPKDTSQHLSPQFSQNQLPGMEGF